MSEDCIDDLIKRIYTRKKDSVWTLTVGHKGSGKTDWCLSQLERIQRLGLGDAFGTNCNDIKAPFHIDKIDDFETLKATCKMLNPDPFKHGLKRYFFFASEMGKWLPKDQPWKNIDFINELQTVRKYGLCWIGDGIDSIDRRVFNENHFDGYFKKTSVTDPTIARYYDFQRKSIAYIENIPRTNILFNTYDTTDFTMKRKIDEAGIIRLNYEHEIAFKYLDLGSWKKLGISTEEGKRCLMKVLKFYRANYLELFQPKAQDKEVSEHPTEIESEKGLGLSEVTE